MTAHQPPSIGDEIGPFPLDAPRINHYDGSPFERAASYARAVRYGRHIAVSGTVAIADNGEIAHAGDPYRQTLEAFRKAIVAVEELGGRREDIIRTRIFLRVGEDWRAAARAHAELFHGVDPANTSLYAPDFFIANALVEVEVDAVIGSTDGSAASLRQRDGFSTEE